MTQEKVMSPRNEEAPKPPAPQPPLHAAVMEGSVWEIRKMLKDGADPNEYNEEGRMPLHLALLSGRQDLYTVVEALLAHDADVNALCEPEEESPLHLVLKHAPADLAELVALRLIQHGADPSLRDRSLRNPYDYAVGHSYMQVMRVVQESVPVNEAVHELLDQRVEVDARQLILAIQQGRLDDIHRCLGRGGNLNFIDPNGAGAIHYLVAVSPLNKTEVLQLLIDGNVDIDLRTYEGDTALNLAIKSVKLRETDEMVPIVEMLLSHGCKTDLRDLDGKDALALAEERDYQDIVDLLMNIRTCKEIIVDIRIDGFSLVDLVYLDYWEGLRERIEGADITELTEFVQHARINLDEEDEEGRTCIHWAVLRQDTDGISDIIKLLAVHGAEINAKSELEETPLHLAADRGITAAVKTLLSLGADDVSPDYANTHKAIFAGKTLRIGDLLRIGGLPPNCKRCNYNRQTGKTAEARAAINRHTDVVKILRLHKQKRNSTAFEHIKESHEKTFVQPTPMELIPEEDTQNNDSKQKKNKSSACIIV